MKNNLYDAIPRVLDRFDFEKVLRVMQFLEWNWMGYPVTLEQLKAEAERQLTMAVQMFEKRGSPKTGMMIASGGFQATVDTFESGDKQLQLLFYVDESHSSGEY